LNLSSPQTDRRVIGKPGPAKSHRHVARRTGKPIHVPTSLLSASGTASRRRGPTGYL